MLLDGFWKRDLRRIKRSMKFWSRIRRGVLSGFAEHKVNQGLLFSAIIFRKIVEDEADAERIIKASELPMPQLPVLKIKVRVRKIEYVGDTKLFINDPVVLQDYNWDNSVDADFSLAQACNQIIHSYLWSVVYWNSKRIYEILMVSDYDKQKVLYALTIDEWIETIQKVIEKANI